MKLFIGIFLAVGLGLLTGAYFSYTSTQNFVSKSVATTGTVVENRYENSSSNDGGSYHAYIKFATAEGQEVRFRSSVGTNPPSFDQGESVSIYYDPKDPNDARVNTFFQLWFLPILLGGMGTLFTGIPLGILLFSARSKRQHEWLKQNGERISAKYIGVEVDTSMSVNDAHPYRVTAQWLHPQTNQVFVFRSERLWFNPEEFIKEKTFPVYIERGNPKKYFLDISHLPKSGS